MWSKKKVKIAAIKKNGNTIEFIENPSYELQEIAINQNPWSIVYIKKPYDEIVVKSIILDPSLLKRKRRRYLEEKLSDNYFLNLSFEIQKKLVNYDILFSVLIPNIDKRLLNNDIKKILDVIL